VSVTLTCTVACERDGCPTTYVADGWPTAIRRQARNAGWTAKPDRCPAHPPELDVATPTLFDHLEEA
jgi:hypothetical protein